MKKVAILVAGLLALSAVAGCTAYGKYPVGKAPAPVTAKG